MITTNNMLATEQFGVHFMMDGYNADKNKLQDEAALGQLLVDLPLKMGMHTICDPVVVSVGPNNHKDPGGISGFVMIAESHLSFHTFPNRGFVSIDVYTCQNQLDTDKLKAELTEAFGINNSDVYVQKRGLSYPSENIYS